jgi:hypothetical protein
MIIGTRTFNKNKIVWIHKESDGTYKDKFGLKIKFTSDVDASYTDYVVFNTKEERDRAFLCANDDLDNYGYL